MAATMGKGGVTDLLHEGSALGARDLRNGRATEGVEDNYYLKR